MKKRLILFGLCMLFVCPVFAEEPASIESEVITTSVSKNDYTPQLLEKIKLQRNSIYNALNLSPCQLDKNKEIEAKRYAELEPQLTKFCKAKYKIKELTEKKCADKNLIKSANKELDVVKKDIKNLSNKYDKEFKKLLTSEQKAKYNMIRKLKRNDLKKAEKIQQNGGKPSDLRPFGQPISQAAYTEKRKQENCIWNKLKRNKDKCSECQ